MVEIEVAPEDDEGAPKRVGRFLEGQGAQKAEGQSGAPASGASAGTRWMTFLMPSGQPVEVWYDNWMGTSIRGEAQTVSVLAKSYLESERDA